MCGLTNFSSADLLTGITVYWMKVTLSKTPRQRYAYRTPTCYNVGYNILSKHNDISMNYQTVIYAILLTFVRLDGKDVNIWIQCVHSQLQECSYVSSAIITAALCNCSC